jgi:hypothetical protein
MFSNFFFLMVWLLPSWRYYSGIVWTHWGISWETTLRITFLRPENWNHNCPVGGKIVGLHAAIWGAKRLITLSGQIWQEKCLCKFMENIRTFRLYYGFRLSVSSLEAVGLVSCASHFATALLCRNELSCEGCHAHAIYFTLCQFTSLKSN